MINEFEVELQGRYIGVIRRRKDRWYDAWVEARYAHTDETTIMTRIFVVKSHKAAHNLFDKRMKQNTAQINVMETKE